MLLAVNKPNLNSMESHCSCNLCPAVSTEFKSRGIPTTYSPLWKVGVLIKNGCASRGKNLGACINPNDISIVIVLFLRRSEIGLLIVSSGLYKLQA